MTEYDIKDEMRWPDTMGTTTVTVPKYGGVYKYIDDTFIPWYSTEPDAQVNCLSWVFITNKTTTQADEGKWKYRRGNKTWTHKKGPAHTSQFRPTPLKERIKIEDDFCN